MSPAAFARLKAELKAAKATKSWWSARQLIANFPTNGLDASDRDYLQQQLALCTYKDPELRRTDALREALDALLVSESSTVGTTSAETAGIAGAIHKRLWELDGRESHLRDALDWYECGAALILESDAPFDAYPVVNAAFAAELLAHVRNDESSPPLRQRAAAHRQTVLERSSPESRSQWWGMASILEALVGQGDLAQIDDMLDSVRELAARTDAWELESTATQLVRLGTYTDPPLDAASLEPVLRAMLPGGHPDAWRGFGHRFGIALSGGGFRASLFHFGVLARLAELDLLRRVDVLSCVSGGSIAGAAYYSKLATLVEHDDDAAITRDDVTKTLNDCIETFTAAVSEQNIRMRAFFGPLTLLRAKAASRTKRAGHLFVRHLIQPMRPDADVSRLDGLKTMPKGYVRFVPKNDNWNRGTRVPTLILNATSLGTGRPWRFTPTALGEPDEPATSIDPIARLEPIWLDRNLPSGTALPTVGDAIAASACVPGLFPPLRLKGLYPDRVVSLVDGGVYDNQGISGLLEHDCTELFVSDASGLLPETRRPSSFILRVLLRVNGVLMAAIRTVTGLTTAASEQTGQVRAAWFVHMLRGIPIERIAPTGQKSVRRDEPTPSPIDVDVQRAAAALRTDLDRFTIAESWTLMACGYRLARAELSGRPHPLAAEEVEFAWPFRAVDPWIDQPQGRARLLRELRRGSRVFFKWFPGGRQPLSRATIEAGPPTTTP